MFKLIVAILMIAVLGGCSSQPPAGQTQQQSGVDQTKSVPGAPSGAPKVTTAPPPQASPSPALAPSPPLAVKAGEPKGKVVYGLDFSLAPVWLDPQENAALITPYSLQYALHDALVKHLPGQQFAPSLAESYEIAPDFKSATFKLRQGVKFHNGDPVTPEDVKWTFENYKGANAKILKDKTAGIETPDPRTVKFTFKEPFLDFLVLYGSPASGAGWIVPAKYYQQVGPDGFKQKPIGAGPYKFVRQVAGQEVELEAFTDYWRKTPQVKTLIMKGLPEATTRVAGLQAGELDFVHQVPGQLTETVTKDPKLTVVPVYSGVFYLEFPGFEKPDSPFNNPKVRQAVSLALDRPALSTSETAGLAQPGGNWIPHDWPGALEWPVFPYDPAKAKQLLTEAGYPDGFDVEQLTPVPPYFSLGERVITALRLIGIRTKLNQMERASYVARLSEGPNALPGLVLNASGAPGDAASRVRAFAICKGASSRTCVPEIDKLFDQYERAVDLKERERLLNEVQKLLMDNYIFVSVYRLGYANAQGPRIANSVTEIIGAIPQYVYVGPYEDIRLKE